MNPILTNTVGALAAACAMGSFVPQAIKIWRERDAESVSLGMYLVTVAGFALWAVYGVLLGSWPLVGSNIVCLTLAATVVVLKLRFDRTRKSAGGGPPAH